MNGLIAATVLAFIGLVAQVPIGLIFENCERRTLMRAHLAAGTLVLPLLVRLLILAVLS